MFRGRAFALIAGDLAALSLNRVHTPTTVHDPQLPLLVLLECCPPVRVVLIAAARPLPPPTSLLNPAAPGISTLEA
jgi:hypothetical protein